MTGQKRKRRGTPRDTTVPTWTRRVARLRRLAEELKAEDFEVREPDNLDTPPGRRIANTSTDL